MTIDSSARARSHVPRLFVLGSNVLSDIVGFIGDLLIDIDVTAFRRKPRREL
jgi:hypothetical protein